MHRSSVSYTIFGQAAANDVVCDWVEPEVLSLRIPLRMDGRMDGWTFTSCHSPTQQQGMRSWYETLHATHTTHKRVGPYETNRRVNWLGRSSTVPIGLLRGYGFSVATKSARSPVGVLITFVTSTVNDFSRSRLRS